MRLLLFILTMLLLAAPLHAKDKLSIVAVVGEEAITSIDVANRLRFILMTLNAPPTSEAEQKLLPQVLDQLVNEALFRGEANRLQLTTSDAEMDRAIALIEANNNMQPGTMLSTLDAANIPRSTLIQKIRAELLWNKIIRHIISPRVSVRQIDLLEAKDRTMLNLGEEHVILQEVQIKKGSLSEEQLRTLGALIQQHPEQFDEAVARYSQAPSRHNNGVRKQVSVVSLAKPIEKAVSMLDKGEVSDWISMDDHYLIVKIIEREYLREEPNMVRLLFINFDEKNRMKKQSLLDAGFVSSCKSFKDELESHAIDVMMIENKLAHLAPAIQEQLSGMQAGMIAPFGDEFSGDKLIVRCKSKVTKVELPSDKFMREQIYQAKVAQESQHYLRDLKREALIEVRID